MRRFGFLCVSTPVPKGTNLSIALLYLSFQFVGSTVRSRGAATGLPTLPNEPRASSIEKTIDILIFEQNINSIENAWFEGFFNRIAFLKAFNSIDFVLKFY